MTHSFCVQAVAALSLVYDSFVPLTLMNLIRCGRTISPSTWMSGLQLISLQGQYVYPRVSFWVFFPQTWSPLPTAKLWWPEREGWALALLPSNHGNSPKTPTHWPRAPATLDFSPALPALPPPWTSVSCEMCPTAGFCWLFLPGLSTC